MNDEFLIKQKILKKMELSDYDKNNLYHNITRILKEHANLDQAALFLVQEISNLYKSKLIDLSEEPENSITNPIKDGKPRFWRAS